MKYSAKDVFDYIELADDYSIYEILPPSQWVGKSITEINVRAEYNVHILGTKNKDGIKLLPGSDYVFSKDEHLMIVGQTKDIEKIVSKS